MKTELNNRQWRLYDFLKSQGDKYTKQIEVAKNLEQFYGECSEDNFHDSKVRFLITSDIRFINQSGIIQKVIISNANGIKLSNEEEFDSYINAELSAIFRKLSRARIKLNKASKNNQGRIVFGGEREFIEAFIGGTAK
ncbi:MAG: hypothetical protein RSA24_03740 [Clostridia bacterium]